MLFVGVLIGFAALTPAPEGQVGGVSGANENAVSYGSEETNPDVVQQSIAIEIEKDAAAQTSEAPSEQNKIYIPVVKVVDGDTLSVRLGGEIVTVRMIGIDTPETVDPRKPVECFGKEASDYAKMLLDGRMVHIEQDPTQGELDKYGRLLAYVYLENDLLVNHALIENGYAHEYTYNIPYRYQKEFQTAEEEARAAKRGLWADGACEVEEIKESPQARPAPPPSPSSSYGNGYTCSANVYNCSDFSTHAEAQHVYLLCGGVENDIHRLDRDSDGDACESLP
jgi:micrococcal nuclease